MHRDQFFGAQFQKGFYRLFRVHVNLAPGWRFIGSNWKQRQVDTEAIANFLETRKISRVPTMKDRAAIRRDHKSSEIAMQICKKSSAPVVTGRERNFERPELDCLPIVEFM